MKFAVALFTSTFLLMAAGAHAEVKLPAVISDHMVLQQEKPANVWGWAAPGENITVQLSGKSVATTAGPDGKWNARLRDLKPGPAGELIVTGKNKISVKDVLVGEVWICSGQSNMEWRVAGVTNAQQEIAAANFPMIRMFTVERDAAEQPKDDCKGTWQICTPEAVPGFSAVAYFFGRKLQQTLQVPVGLIHTSWGGTPAEMWTPSAILAADPDFKPFADAWNKTKADYPKAKENYEKALAAWETAAAAAKAEGKQPPRKPNAPRGDTAFGAPGCLYNAMIAPLVPCTIQGAIWYQGESNASRAREYGKLFPTMILSWRQRWNEEFPFLYVQLANYNARGIPPTGEPEESQWAELREAQLMTLELPHTAMAVTIDIGEARDIHPKNKQEVGRRLALAAEATVYYRDTEFSGPLPGGSQEEDGKIRLSFRHAEGLKAADGGKLKGFAVAGDDRKFVWADTSIEGDHIIVSSSKVPKPVAVRYGWADNPDCNLTNAAGLPASPFRTDEWPYVPPVAAPAAGR
jgi:sialate O-acetylesterase